MAMEPIETKCKNCHFYKALSDKSIGLCRYNPPTVITNKMNNDGRTVFPNVTPDETPANS